MGVPLLLTWLRRRFSECFSPAEGDLARECVRGHTDNLYIDLNSLIYQSAAIIAGGGGSFSSVDEVEEEVLVKLMGLLDHILFDLVQPAALVFIAVDGVSPLGKMSQQRARRRRRPAASRGAPPPGLDSLWDVNTISVGTGFMSKMTTAIHAYAVSRTERINAARLEFEILERRRRAGEGEGATSPPCQLIYRPNKPISIVVDGVMRPGEGENKILEVIRRFRAQAAYNPNTTHVICSTDTDVTVSCLILHEPRIFVLRYEPPPSLGGKASIPNEDAAAGSGRGGGRVVDTWLSTFFSLHTFRESLRKLLGFRPPLDTSKLHEDTESEFFERALHDVVFSMLLFGNDFLPLLGGGIREGTLDALLQTLSSDFVSRHRTVVVAETNQIQFESARYLLGCLADIMRERGGSGTLAVFADGAELSWEFTTDDKQFQEKQRERERMMEKKCYCYWTMLQWALQYSAGIVEHWGCYYPYSDAPPLEKLRQYCGVLSYDGVVDLVAAHHATIRGLQCRGNTAGSDGVGVSSTSSLGLPCPLASESTMTAVRDSTALNRRGEPTDVMVQLLVLIPPRSVALLPVIIQQHYNEIQEAVQPPVEELDLVQIQEWCEGKKVLLRKEEQTRFHFYKLLSSDSILCGPEATCADTEQQPRILSNEVVFIAYWSTSTFRQQAEDAVQASLSKPSPLTTAMPVCSNKISTVVSENTRKRSAASFFGSKLVKGGVSAAVTALQTSPLRPTVTHPSTPTAAESTLSTTEETNTPQAGSYGEPVRANGGACEAAILSDVDGCYFWYVAPCVVLPDDGLRKAVGVIEGNRFLVDGSANAAIRSSGNVSVLSRDTYGRMGVRLQWEVATMPPLSGLGGHANRAAMQSCVTSLLLPGYTPPVVRTVMEKVRSEREKISMTGPCTDPWRQNTSLKRLRDDDKDVSI
ncbi:unnamed protein product [Phytomonas sp. Hart1]|nr:unnamed protein product [Phytomonas sp. Hart1]|eukprot:CCW68295.1 unnamed protein product [Phytomonas sp. isolate Hart1]